jgi:hypothetical protein
MVTATPSVIYSAGQWRRQILAYRDPQSIVARAGFVAASFIGCGNESSAFVEIERVSVVLLFEEFSADHARPERVPLRLVGYRASRVPHGVQWGGEDNSQLFKDLTLAPQFGARGQRIDRRKLELLSLARKLNCRLNRAARHPAAPWSGLRLPPMWAGFRQNEAGNLVGNGPEFEELRRHHGVSATALFQGATRHVFGLILYPLDWVSGQLKHVTGIFAELRPSLQRQTCRMVRLPVGLIGYQGASAFDFYSSRHRNLRRNDTKFSNPGINKLLIAETDRSAAHLMQTCGCGP